MLEAEEKPSLLLVDDDETFCLVLSRALERRGFSVQVAYDVKMGEQMARSTIPEYAVVDLRIGEESGLQMVRILKDLDQHTRIVMLTGYSSIATAVEAIKLGATHYLTKPADADQVCAALQKTEGDEQVDIAETPVSVKRLEWEHLQKVLLENDGNISATARALNMHRRTLQRKLQKRPVQE